MLAYASQNMAYDLLLQGVKKAGGLEPATARERRDTHREEDSMVVHIKILFC
jgi:hypothetical protein